MSTGKEVGKRLMKFKRVGTSRKTRKPGEEPMKIEAGEERGREEDEGRTGRQAGQYATG